MALTTAQNRALTEIASSTLYVGRDPGRPFYGSGHYPATLRTLIASGLVTRGKYEPSRGSPLVLTAAGHAEIGGAL